MDLKLDVNKNLPVLHCGVMVAGTVMTIAMKKTAHQVRFLHITMKLGFKVCFIEPENRLTLKAFKKL